MNDNKRYSIKEKALKLLAPTLFLVFTFAIYMPSSLFLGNIDDFSLDYVKIIPLILLASLVISVIIYAIGAVILNSRLFDSYVLLVFSFAIGFYIQGNFLNPSFNTLNGKEINWDAYKINGIISIIAWILCFVVPQVVYVFKKNIIELIVKWGSYFVTAMQLVSLVVLILTTHKEISNDFAVTKNGEFEISSKNNTIMFVVDTLDAEWFENEILSNDEYKDNLTDFTYFEDAVAGGAPTILGIPALLTGRLDMNAETSINQYYKDTFSNFSMFKQMQDNNYQVKLYSEYAYLDNCDKENVDNLKLEQEYVISSRKGFMEYLYKFVSFYSMPQFLKKYFWFYSGDFSQFISLKDSEADLYELDDAQFYKDYKSSGITTQNKKNTFVVYHLYGAHGPYVMNEEAEAIPENSTELAAQIKGVFKIIFEYIEELKAKGLYDNSTIIITADHGGVALYQHPAVLVKDKNTHQDFTISDSKISFTNVHSTIAKSCLGDNNGYDADTVFEVGDKDVVRYHVAPNELGGEVYPKSNEANNQPWTLYIIPGKATDTDSFTIVPYDKYEEYKQQYGFTED